MQTRIAAPIGQVAERMSRIDAAMRSRMWFTLDATKRWTHSRIVQGPVAAQVSRLSCWLAGHLTDEWLVALLATMLSIGAYAWYARNGLTLAYPDALSRMEIARRMLMSRTPGLAQLGTTWLPLHFMLMLPVIWIDPLFHSGLAGSLPSMVAYVTAAVYMFRMGHLLFASRGAGWVAAAAIMFNPSLMYMQSTAMSETPLLCTTVLTTYYALRWARSYQAIDMVKAAAAAAAGTLIRYDGWATAGAVALIVACLAWRRQGYKGAEAWAILYSLLAFAGCAAWVVYNAVIFHDPLLAFFYGSSKGDRSLSLSELPGYHNPSFSFEMYGYTAAATVGWMTTVMAVVGLIVFMVHFRLRAIMLPVYTLLVPFAFYWLVFYMGTNQSRMPELHLGGYDNIRFGMQMIPAGALFMGFLANQRRLFLRRLFLTVALGVIVSFGIENSARETPWVMREPFGAGTGVSAAGVSAKVTIPVAAQWFTSHYHGGNVLISYVPHAPLMFYLMRDIPDYNFITDSNGRIWKDAVAHPQTSVEWIVMTTGDNDYVWAALGKRQDWRRYFVLRKDDGVTQFYERIGDSR